MRIRWTSGKNFFVYSDGYHGWRWVICAGPLAIFISHRDDAWWVRYRARKMADFMINKAKQ